MTAGHDIKAWRGCHAGETVLVCGCGASLTNLRSKPEITTIGVNDVGRHFDPDYLVVLNPKSQFKPDRFAAIEATRARAVFSSVAGFSLPGVEVVPLRLGKRGGTEVSPDGRIPHTRNSPYVALTLALFFGAKRVGLLGVDFTDDHFFGKTGPHPLARELRAIDKEYRRIFDLAAQNGVEIVNLSRQSRLSALPKADLEDFVAPRRTPTRVLHISSTNCAGAIWNLHQLMQADPRFESRVATASPVTRGRSKPRTFPHDLLWSQKAAVWAEIERADILHFHNFVDAKSPALSQFAGAMRGKRSVLQVHSEPAVLAPLYRGRDPVTRTDIPVLVIAQKHARFYPQATPVLNAMDPARFAKQGPNSGIGCALPRVVFTPSDLNDYPQTPPTCRGKGYRATRAILERLARSGVVEPVIGFDLSHSDALALSAGAAAKIDECVTGGYHLTSLEALSQGLATFAWLDEDTRRLLARMTGSDEAALPWVSVKLDALEAKLTEMARAPESFAQAGKAGRSWMLRYWTPNAVLDPILKVYEAEACRGVRPVRSPPRAPDCATGSASDAPGADGALRGHVEGSKHPRRSEDFEQRIYLGAKLLAARGSAQGRVAHVLGNGPSLADTDLAPLQGDIVIGVNAAQILEPRLGRAFDYYCVSDRRFLATSEGHEMANAAKNATRVFAGYCAGFLKDEAEINYVRILPGDGASDDLTRGLHHGCSVALFAAQLAAWLGADEIRLHGMECNYDAGRFYSGAGSKARRPDPGNYPRVARSAEALAALLARSGRVLSVSGPSRLTGSFGSPKVRGIKAVPVAGSGAQPKVAQMLGED